MSSRRIGGHRWLLLIALVAAASPGCGEPTAPDPDPTQGGVAPLPPPNAPEVAAPALPAPAAPAPAVPPHPAAGSYILSAVVNSFTAVGSCDSYLDGLYCARTVPVEGGSISGGLTLSDTLLGGTVTPMVSADARLRLCLPAAACTEDQTAFRALGIHAARYQANDSLSASMHNADGARWLSLHGLIQGDSIVGVVRWVTQPARRWYSGRFVARRASVQQTRIPLKVLPDVPPRSRITRLPNGDPDRTSHMEP